jgi:hypothetical protein
MTAPTNMFEWSRAYFQNRDRSLHETRATMAALMTYGHFNKMTCFPSQARLAADTGLSVETIRRHLKKNMDAGWLVRLRIGSSGKHNSLYRLVVPTNYSPHRRGESEWTPLTDEVNSPRGRGVTPLRDEGLTTKEPLTNYPLETPLIYEGSPETASTAAGGSPSPSDVTRQFPTPLTDEGSWLGDPFSSSSDDDRALALLADAIRASDDGRVAAKSSSGIMQVPSAEAKRIILTAIDCGDLLLVPGEYGKYLQLSN